MVRARLVPSTSVHVEEEIAKVEVSVGPGGTRVVEDAVHSEGRGVDGEVVEADVRVDEGTIDVGHGMRLAAIQHLGRAVEDHLIGRHVREAFA